MQFFRARMIHTSCGCGYLRPRSISLRFFAAEANYRGTDIDLRDFASRGTVFAEAKAGRSAVLNVTWSPQREQASLGVIAPRPGLGIPFEKIVASLRRFEHARRQNLISKSALLVDDYAHHPTEINATLATAKSVGQSCLFSQCFSPRYSP